jgi:hypothetical protein
MLPLPDILFRTDPVRVVFRIKRSHRSIISIWTIQNKNDRYHTGKRTKRDVPNDTFILSDAARANQLKPRAQPVTIQELPPLKVSIQKFSTEKNRTIRRGNHTNWSTTSLSLPASARREKRKFVKKYLGG